MSQLPRLTVQEIEPRAFQSSADLGRAPASNGFGLDRALLGASEAFSGIANAQIDLRREREIQAERDRIQQERDARRDEMTQRAMDDTYIAEFQTGTIQWSSGVEAKLSQQPVQLRMAAFDAEVQSRFDELDANLEGRDELKAKQKLWLTAHVATQRGRIADQIAKETGDAARASLVGLQTELETQVATGGMTPGEAGTIFQGRVAALAGTALSREQAASLAEKGTAGLYAKQVETLYLKADEDPEANENLRQMLKTPEAQRYLDRTAIRSMERSLESQMASAEKASAQRILSAAQRTVSMTLPRDEASPVAWWSDKNPQQVASELDDVVALVMDQPGTDIPGAIVDGRIATEADVREALFLPALKAASAAGDRTGFEMFAGLLRSNDPTVGGSPKVEEAIAVERRQMAERETKAEGVKAATQAIGAVWASGGNGRGNPAFRSQEAIDKWAENALATDPSLTYGGLARFAIDSGAPMPSAVSRMIANGFGDNASTEQTMAALGTLREIRGMDPLAATRIADGHGAVATALLNMPPAPYDPGMSKAQRDQLDAERTDAIARTLLSPVGKDAANLARKITQGGVADIDINAASVATEAGITISAGALPVNARATFDAAFAYRMAQAAEANGYDSLASADEKRIGDIARQAMQDTLSTVATVDIADLGAGAFHLGIVDIPGTWDYNGTRMVDPQVYGLAPGSRHGYDSEFGKFLEEGRRSFDQTGFLGLDFNIFSAQDVRPDLGFGEYQTHDALNRVVYIPIMDRTSSQPTGFLRWDARSGVGLDPVSEKDFPSVRQRFLQSATPELRDPEREFRRPPGASSQYMADFSPLMSERFRDSVRAQGMAIGLKGMELDEWLEERAMSIGWKGFSAPVAVQESPN